MTFERVLITDRNLEPFLAGGDNTCLLHRVHALIQQQHKNWDDLKKAQDLLKQAKTRKVFLESLDVTLQWNTARIKSTSSCVDRQSLMAMPCFLCVENLPFKQQALLYNNQWLILNNPAPIFPDHLVVSCINHRPQIITQALPAMISLIGELHYRYAAFYNGPSCGASAPEHLHFQMCPAGSIPIIRQIMNITAKDLPHKRFRTIYNDTAGTCYAAVFDNRAMLLCKSRYQSFVLHKLNKIITSLSRQNGICVSREPMVNVIIEAIDGEYFGIIFPRRAHRPSCYYDREPDKILISPGAVDVGGLVILPRKRDFKKINREKLLTVFAEVCHGTNVFAYITDMVINEE